uniref:RNA polymerase II elongation factor ELL n=1 Tax=Schistocephalus solidus TaxID=70667 RepID=A0A0X3Q159_SCHSO
MPLESVDGLASENEYFHLRITESFSRILQLVQEQNSRLHLNAENGQLHITVESLEGCKTFQAEFEAPLTEYYSVAAANQSEQWTHLGIITQKIRMVATAESFDQLRQNIVRAEKGTRKTHFRVWENASKETVRETHRKRPSTVLPKRLPSPLTLLEKNSRTSEN